MPPVLVTHQKPYFFNMGDSNGRNEYTGKVAHDTPLWLPVFNGSVSTPPPSSNRYTVQSEDTLFIIAERFYGDGNQWTRIRDANPGIDPNNLQTGQQINIPAGSVNTPPPSSNRYTVQSEDTLFIIAERFYGDGNQWTRIRDANPGIDPNNLQTGQQLNIPA